MTLFKEYASSGAVPVVEMMDVIDGATWDHNINCDDGYRMRCVESRCAGRVRIKDIWFEERQPYGWLVAENRRVRFNSLHFQGQAKGLTDEFARP